MELMDGEDQRLLTSTTAITTTLESLLTAHPISLSSSSLSTFHWPTHPLIPVPRLVNSLCSSAIAFRTWSVRVWEWVSTRSHPPTLLALPQVRIFPSESPPGFCPTSYKSANPLKAPSGRSEGVPRGVAPLPHHSCRNDNHSHGGQHRSPFNPTRAGSVPSICSATFTTHPPRLSTSCHKHLPNQPWTCDPASVQKWPPSPQPDRTTLFWHPPSTTFPPLSIRW